MKLRELLTTIPYISITGNEEQEVHFLTQDTRETFEENTLYFAVAGTQYDGHAYIDQAIEQGAKVIVLEHLPETLNENVTYVLLENVGPHIGTIASTFYGNPSQKMKVIGVTGTNGKTTVVTMIASLLASLNQKPLLLSTAGDSFNGKPVSLPRHAPSSVEPLVLHKYLAEYLAQGATHCCLEVTSHAAEQGRISGIDFDIAIFTNLTQDHLDYHKTFEAYKTSKKKFFDGLKPEAHAIINIDDNHAQDMVKDTKATITTYGTTPSDYLFAITSSSLNGVDFTVNGSEYHINQLGVFNVYNAVASLVALKALRYDEESIKQGLLNLPQVPGRMEVIQSLKNIFGVVDYAHTPDALENVLSTLKEIEHHNIITVFGCGGDRDRGKRPLMAQAVEKYADHIILTNDNPRTEDEEQIFNDTKAGFSDTAHYTVIPNRKEAIKHAVEEAEEHDIIFVAGKGHEDYQIIGTEKHHFSDKEELTTLLLDE